MKKYAECFSQIPTYNVSGYHLPYPDRNTLTVLVSYSGNSEETISCYNHAKKHNSPCVVITGGGELLKMATEYKDTLIRIPQNLSAKESMAYLTIPPLLVSENFGLWEIPTDRLLEIIEAVNDVIFCCNEFVDIKENQAKILAREIKGKIPIILGVEGCMEAVATSWKELFNLNANYPAHVSTIDQFYHSEIGTLNQNNIIIFLRTLSEDNRLRTQIKRTEEILKSNKIPQKSLWLMGKSSLSKAYAMYTLGSYVSLFLAESEKENSTKNH